MLGHRTDGVFTIEQLRAHGLSDDRVGLLVAQGRLVRRHRGVYADALVAPTRRSHLVAAQYAVGPMAFLSRRTALAVNGYRPLDLRSIEVTIVAEHTPTRHGIVVHRTTVEPLDDEVRLVDGLRVASPMLALLEVAAAETEGELDRLVAELCRRRALDLERLDVAIERRRGLRGVRRLRAALARYRPSEQSHADASTLERDVATWLAEHPDIPAPLRNVRIGPWEVDFHWPAYRVSLEVDGERYHSTPAERERDRVKDAWLQARGHRVLRITEFRFAHDRAAILVDLRAMLARGAADAA